MAGKKREKTVNALNSIIFLFQLFFCFATWIRFKVELGTWSWIKFVLFVHLWRANSCKCRQQFKQMEMISRWSLEQQGIYNWNDKFLKHSNEWMEKKWKLLFNHKCIHDNPIIWVQFFPFVIHMHDYIMRENYKKLSVVFTSDANTYIDLMN